jgi:hypothetical protein
MPIASGSVLDRLFPPSSARRAAVVGGRLYCVGRDHVVAFDFPTGKFLGMIAELPRLNGQALLLLP